MGLFSQVNHHHKNGEYKNNFVKSNLDYINIDKSFVWANVSDIDLELTFDIDFVVSSPMTIGEYNHGSTGFLQTFINTSGILTVATYLPSTPDYDSLVTVQLLESQPNVLRIFNREVFLNEILIGALDEAATNIDVNGTTRRTWIGAGTWNPSYYSLGSFYNVILNNELFPLDEKSGYRVYGNKGSFGTRVTSNAGGLTYINSNMIEKI